ncbi:hypothetical protein Btru_000283 [Bulinus truncatus]|nr:hypothetical protein Btru_000283 [Bulinus truncatus]
MSFLYGGKLFHKRGCYVILPDSPFGRFDSNDNTAEADEEIEVLEGPEVEIVGSFDDSILDKCSLDMDSYKSDSENINIKEVLTEQAINYYQLGMEPDNKYYEVEAIIAGPKKRREHLFKLCYKVRWKGYGPEADTWQPLADLANVQDMIEEYKREKAVEAKHKRKQKPVKEVSLTDNTCHPPASTKSSELNVDLKNYDPEYGTVKDKFWKDLELGRVDHYSDLFAGDMYSKIKGCQRTAHAEAVANIHKQQLHGKPVTDPINIKSSSLKSTSKRHRGGFRNSFPNSAHLAGASKPHSPITNKARKRSSDPFSAKGYTSKRSRRSREIKNGNLSPERKRTSIRSVTSETMSIVTTTSPVLTPPVEPNTRTAPFFNTGPGVTTITYSNPNLSVKNYKPSDDEDESEGNSRMTVSSETMLTVTTETKLLDMKDLILSEDNITSIDEPPQCSKSVNDAASSNDIFSCAQEANGATSSENVCSPSNVKRSTLDIQSEAIGAIERSHDEECLWGGACNRSDCRANRRRNMKNVNSQYSTQSKSSTAACYSPSLSFQPESPSQKYGSTVHKSSLTLAKKSFSSATQAYSSDSSFEEALNSTVSLSRDAVKSSFSHTDTLAHRMHLESSASRISSTLPSNAIETSALSSSFGVRRSSELNERPGLFSDNNSAFSFVRQELGLSLIHDLPLPASSSPGKENFGSSDASVSSLGGHERLYNIMEVGSAESHFEASLSTQSRGFGDAQETRSRKRTGEVSQPLEKLPSPNSRRDSDLDKRISTLTCDELEDLVEQGEEKYSSKEVSLVTNADLLQAVNLGKAEVVKRAVRQSSMTERKLDFEQPDSTGLTLLMRAVQKGTLAIVEMLLEHGVNVNAQQTNGCTALMLAAEQNGVCLVALLLKFGANSSLYTVHSEHAETALMKAIKRQHREVVNLMLRVGVNIAAPTCASISALELAVERRNVQIETLVRTHYQRLEQAFRSRVLVTLEETAELMEPLFPLQCFPLRESNEFIVKFNSNIHPVAQGEGFLLFIAHTKINDKGVRCRFNGSCPIGSVTLNGVPQTPLTKEVNFVTSCHPIIPGCNSLVIHKLEDYTSKAKLTVQAFRAKLLPC